MSKHLFVLLPVLLSFGFQSHDSADSEKSKLCKQSIECVKLAEVGYYEARGETKHGIANVLGVVLNRANDERFPNTVVGVVSQPKQFSYLTSQTYKKGIKEYAIYDLILELAYDMLNKNIENPTTALYFRHKSVRNRTNTGRIVNVIGNHAFFN